MIVTLTMNPALDITTSADQVRPTDKIRCRGARYDAGGGGINVARVASVLGGSVSAVFPVGGPTGDLLTELVGNADVPYRRVAISLPTRESFTVDEESSGQQYRFVLPGPRLTPAEQAKCLDELRYAARSAEIVVASGSLPPGVPSDFYQRVADICRELGVPLVLDTSGGGLATHHVRGVPPEAQRPRATGMLRARTCHRIRTVDRRARAHRLWHQSGGCRVPRLQGRTTGYPARQPTFLGGYGACGQRRRRG